MGVEGAKVLAGVLVRERVALRKLDLGKNGIEDGGVEAFSTYFKHHCEKLKTLSLCSNSLSV